MFLFFFLFLFLTSHPVKCHVPLVKTDCFFFTSALKLIWYVPFHLNYAHTKGQSGEILHLVEPQHYAQFAVCETQKSVSIHCLSLSVCILVLLYGQAMTRNANAVYS